MCCAIILAVMMRLFLRLRVLRDALKARARDVATHRFYRAGGVLVFTFLALVTAMPAHAAIIEMDSIIQSAADFAFQIAAIFTTAIVLIIDVMVPVMTYNSFTNNAVVSAGWAIVRDTVNMFFVVVLIIIAFGTIFGNDRFKWQQQVPRLMVIAIVINFSKTLCGIMIDFGQVVMLTFANALREIAAGNIIQLFGLNQLHSISSDSSAMDGSTTGGGGAGSAFDFLAAGVLSVIMVMVVLVVLLFLVCVLLFRIVGLWVLVILAPMAWFAKGAEDIVKTGLYAKWWGEFKCLVAIGPVLTFFLWLTLAVAGAGDIAVKSGFDVTSESNSADFISDGLQLKNFMSFLIGVILVFASFDAASQVCSEGKSGKMIGKMQQPFKNVATRGAAAIGTLGIGGGVGRKVLSGGVAAGGLAAKGVGVAAPLMAKGAVGAAGLAAAGAKRAPLTRAAREARAKVFGGDEMSRSEKARESAKKHGNSAYGRWRAASKNKKADVLAQAAGSNVQDEAEKLKGQTRAQKTDSAKRLADMKGMPTSIQGEAKGLAAYGDMINDPTLQKEMGADRVEAMHNKYGSRYKKLNAGDAAKSGGIKSFEKANAHYSGVDLNEIDSWDDAKNLSEGALKDPKVREHLKKLKSPNTKGKNKKPMSAYDSLLAGNEGNKKAAAVGLNPADRFEMKTDNQLNAVPVSDLVKNGGPAAMGIAAAAATDSGDLKRAQALITNLSHKYTSGTTSPAQKLEILGKLDALGAKFSADKGIGTSKGRDNGRMLKHLNRLRGAAEDKVTPPVREFGEGQSGADYAKEYRNASDERKGQARGAMRGHIESKTDEKKKATDERDALVNGHSGNKDKLIAEIKIIEDDGGTLEKARQAAHKELGDKANELGQRYQKAQKRADFVKTQPGNLKKDVDDAQSEAEALFAQHKAAKAEAFHGTTANKRAVENHDSVIKVKVERDQKVKQMNEINPDEMEDVKKLGERIGVLTEHIKQSQEAWETLGD